MIALNNKVIIDSCKFFLKKLTNNVQGSNSINLCVFPFFQPRDAMDAPREGGAVGGAAGGVGGNDLRRSVTSLLDAMRDLISNFHLADVPNEGDVDSDDDNNRDG